MSMLVQIGRGRAQPAALVDLLLACHARIRSFLALARAAAQRADRPEPEIAEACAAVDAYFREARRCTCWMKNRVFSRACAARSRRWTPRSRPCARSTSTTARS